MPNLELYRVFGQVALRGSFSQAARDLFLSQSAVSQSVAQLEHALGRRLFVRSRRGVSLTPEGEMLFEHVNQALSVLQAGEERLERMRHLQAGELSIGAGDTISEHYLLPYLERFHSQYPEIRLKVINRTSCQLLDLLRAGAVDLAFVNLPLNEPGLCVLHRVAVQDIFVASEKFSSLRGRALGASELARCHLVMLETLSNSRRYVDDFFWERHGLHLLPEIELGAHDLLLEFARIGLGVACVIRQFSRSYLESGKLFELQLREPLPPRAFGLCSFGNSFSFATEAFLSMLTPQGP